MNGSIVSYAMINSNEFITPAGSIPHPGDNLFDISRESVYSEAYRPFGKMGNSEKLLFSTAALAISDRSLPEETGVVLVTPEGSLAIDNAYMDSVREQFPRPALFAATLPSAPIAELTIPFTLRGPNRVIADNNESAGILNALFLLERGDTPTVLVGYLNPDPSDGYAVVFILERSGGGLGDISFIRNKSNQQSNSLFRDAVAAIHGRNNFSTSMTKGTINLKVKA